MMIYKSVSLYKCARTVHCRTMHYILQQKIKIFPCQFLVNLGQSVYNVSYRIFNKTLNEMSGKRISKINGYAAVRLSNMKGKR